MKNEAPSPLEGSEEGSADLLAGEIVSLRNEGRWRDLAALLTEHPRFAEETVDRFHVESDGGWIEAVEKLKLMGFLPRGLRGGARSEVIEELRAEIQQLEEQMSLNDGRITKSSPRLPPLMVLFVDERLGQVTARITEAKITTPLDGAHSRYRFYYRHFDSGSKMDVYEPAGVLVVDEGRYTPVSGGELPEEVRDIFEWYRQHVVVKAVRSDDTFARKMNAQVDEGYMVATYCLGHHPSFVPTTFFRNPPEETGSGQPHGVSLVLQEPKFRGVAGTQLRPIFVGQEGMVVVVQRRAPSTVIDVVLDTIRRASEERMNLVEQELGEVDHLLNKISSRGREEIRRLKEERKQLESLWADERQHIVGDIYRIFQGSLSSLFGVRDMDVDFERNYSLALKEGAGDYRHGVRNAIRHVVSFDFDQFRTLKSFSRSQGRLPDVFERDVPAVIRDKVIRMQTQAVS